MNQNTNKINPEIKGALILLQKMLSIFAVIVYSFIAIIAFLILLYAIPYVFNLTEYAANVESIRTLVDTIWEKTLPLAKTLLTIASPIFILIILLAALRWILISTKSTIHLKKYIYDLPSLLAIIIVLTICIIPIMGSKIPGVLENVALVIVGFYFGRRKENNIINSEDNT